MEKHLLTTQGKVVKSPTYSISFYLLQMFVFLRVRFREAGHHELADRLVEIQYELTDRLAFYLCGRKPGMM